MVQIDLYFKYDKSEFDDNLFDDNPFCKNIDYQSIMFDNEVDKCVKWDDHQYHTSRSKSDSEIFHYKPRSSKNQSFNKFPELFDLPDTDIVH